MTNTRSKILSNERTIKSKTDSLKRDLNSERVSIPDKLKRAEELMQSFKEQLSFLSNTILSQQTQIVKNEKEIKDLKRKLK